MKSTRSKLLRPPREVVDPSCSKRDALLELQLAPRPSAPGAGSARRRRSPAPRRRGGRARSCRSRRCSRCRARASPSGRAGSAARISRHLNGGKSPSGWSGAVWWPAGQVQVVEPRRQAVDLPLDVVHGGAAQPVRLQGHRAVTPSAATWRSSSAARRAGVCSASTRRRAALADRLRPLGARALQVPEHLLGRIRQQDLLVRARRTRRARPSGR